MSEMPTELDIAQGIKGGMYPSPWHFPNCSLYAMRITGTGASYRLAHDEYVWRDPSIYLNDEFLARCNGLPVIFEHPERSMLNSEEFANRIVGTIMLPYIKGDEVWGIARIYDASTIEILNNEKMSTSPGVVFGDNSVNRKIEIDDGNMLLIEGKPTFLDHLAICVQGVWDKMEEPDGITSSTTGALKMADEPTDDKDRKDAAPAWAADAFKGIHDTFGKMMERLDAQEKRMDESFSKWAKEEGEEAAHKDEQARKDAAEKAEADAKARLDAVEEAVKKAMPVERSDEEAAEMADAQARCDSVASMFGKHARAPIAGESPIAYRRRLASEYKQHSAAWKDVDLAALPDNALRNAEAAIYADAQTAARTPVGLAPGQLREIKRESAAGHKISEFTGDPNGWMNYFKPPMRARVTGLGIKQGVN